MHGNSERICVLEMQIFKRKKRMVKNKKMDKIISWYCRVTLTCFLVSVGLLKLSEIPETLHLLSWEAFCFVHFYTFPCHTVSTDALLVGKRFLQLPNTCIYD